MPVDVAAHFGAVDEVSGNFVLLSGNRRRPEFGVFPASLAGTQRQGAAPGRRHCHESLFFMWEKYSKPIKGRIRKRWSQEHMS